MAVNTYVALLRAVNVGAANRCKMVDLRAAFVKAGFADAVTYIQSGNVIFTSPDSATDVRTAVERVMTTEMKLRVRAIMRTSKQLATIAAANPFSAEDSSGLYVFFLASKPAKAAVADLEAIDFAQVRSKVVGAELYAHYSAGLGSSKLTNAVVEKKLGVAATARNWNVTGKLAELAASHDSGG